MRKDLCDALVARAGNENMLFLTGDLGFMALEPLQKAMGSRFINAGVSEQNMMSVSAALAAQGFEVWVYSIAPFCYARPFEQIRNDIALHRLPVNLIGNGGGYGYGVQGPTHHALEDYGVLLTLGNLEAFVPVFDEDVPAAVQRAAASKKATYLRLGRGEKPAGYAPPPYAAIRQLTFGEGMTVVSIGPLAGSFIAAFERLPQEERPNLWAVAELPLVWENIPDALVEQISTRAELCVAEEHVSRGGLASELLLLLAERGIALRNFEHLSAVAQPGWRYGSQTFMRKQCGLDVEHMLSIVLGKKAQPIA
jgi:transketolase